MYELLPELYAQSSKEWEPDWKKKKKNIRDEVASAGKFHVPAYFAAPIMFNAALVKNAVFVLFRSREDVQRDIPGFLDDKETSFA